MAEACPCTICMVSPIASFSVLSFCDLLSLSGATFQFMANWLCFLRDMSLLLWN